MTWFSEPRLHISDSRSGQLHSPSSRDPRTPVSGIGAILSCRLLSGHSGGASVHCLPLYSGLSVCLFVRVSSRMAAQAASGRRRRHRLPPSHPSSIVHQADTIHYAAGCCRLPDKPNGWPNNVFLVLHKTQRVEGLRVRPCFFFPFSFFFFQSCRCLPATFMCLFTA